MARAAKAGVASRESRDAESPAFAFASLSLSLSLLSLSLRRRRRSPSAPAAALHSPPHLPPKSQTQPAVVVVVMVTQDTLVRMSEASSQALAGHRGYRHRLSSFR